MIEKHYDVVVRIVEVVVDEVVPHDQNATYSKQPPKRLVRERTHHEVLSLAVTESTLNAAIDAAVEVLKIRSKKDGV